MKGAILPAARTGASQPSPPAGVLVGVTRCLALFAGVCLALAGGVAARPVYDLAPVDAALEDLVDEHGLAGASLRLARNGAVVHTRHLGDHGPDSRVPIASASKWLSALTLARLVEAGTLRWDSRVGEYFPQASVAVRGITLVQLFSHTSGIDIEDHACLSSRQDTLRDCANQILAMPLAWSPGTAFAYGGNSMQVAGAMAEIASGRSWDALFLAEVVQPLGLTATDWTAAAIAPGYVPNPNPRIGGGARSTLADYGRVVDMLLAGGLHDGRSFVSAQTLATMALDRTVGLQIAASPVADYDYGYGFGQWVEAKDVYGATYRVSSPGAFGFTPWVDWRSGSNGVVLVGGSGSAMRDDLTALERLCLRQLDFRRETLPRGQVPPSADDTTRESAPRPRAIVRALPPNRLDAEQRAH